MARRGSRCAVYGCLNYKILDSKKFSFYRLPKDAKRCAVWINCIGRPDLAEALEKKGSASLHNNHVVCSAHFTAKDFRNERLLSQGVWPTAVPSVFNQCGPFRDNDFRKHTIGESDTIDVKYSYNENWTKATVKDEILSSKHGGDNDGICGHKKKGGTGTGLATRESAASDNNEGYEKKRNPSLRSVSLTSVTPRQVNWKKKFIPILPKPGPAQSVSNNIALKSDSTVITTTPSDICPSPFLIVDGKKDAKLAVSPVVLLLKSDSTNLEPLSNLDSSSCSTLPLMNNEGVSPTALNSVKRKCLPQNMNSKKATFQNTQTDRSLAIKNKKNNNVNNKVNIVTRRKGNALRIPDNNTPLVISVRPKDVDITEIRVHDRPITCEKNENVSVLSSTRPAVNSGFKRGVDYRLIDDEGKVVQVTASSLCRICGRFGKEHLVSLFSDVCSKNHVLEIIDEYLPVKVSKQNNKLPLNICHLCVSYLIDWQRLIHKCEATDKWLHEVFNVPHNVKRGRNVKCYQDKLSPGKRDTATVESSDRIISQQSPNTQHSAVEFDDVSNNNNNGEFDHDYCTVGSSAHLVNNNDCYDNASDDTNNNNESVNSDTNCEPHTTFKAISSTVETDVCNNESHSVEGDITSRHTYNTRKRKLSDSTIASRKLNSSNTGNRYKLFRLLVASDIKDDCAVSRSSNSCANSNVDGDDLSLLPCKSSDKINIENINRELEPTKSVKSDANVNNVKKLSDATNEGDEDSRDTLSPPPQPLLYDVLATVGKSDNCDPCDTNNGMKENMSVYNKDYIIPPKPLSSERYIAKQGYKVGITLSKCINKDDVCSEGAENATAIETLKGLGFISINVSKEKKQHYKLFMTAFRHTKHSYSRLSIFDCEHCVFYQMTANEFGKHMRSFHPDKPMTCPICKRVFIEDYNLIIHLQVTSCGQLGLYDTSADVGNEIETKKLDLSESSELSVTIKFSDNCDSSVTDKKSEGNVVRDLDSEVCCVDNKQSFSVEKSFYEIHIETWKPSTTCVSFEPGIVILDSLDFLSPELSDIVLKEIEKLLKLEVFSLFDCNALKTMLDTKVSQVLKTAQDENKKIFIKSVDSTTMTSFEDANSTMSKPLGRKLQKPMKTLFRLIKRGRPSLKEIYSAGPLMKTLKVGRPRKENKETYCDKCNIRFSNSKSLFRHRRLNHVDRKCKYCDLVFSAVGKLNRHEKEHEKNNILFCEICNLRFTTKDSVQKHNLLTHNIGEYATCEFCSKKFFTKSGLYSHKKNIHSNEQHLCPHCGQIYKSLSGLKCHIQSAHIVQTDIICPVCNKLFRNRRKLNVHMGSHRQKHTTYSCDKCNKTFHSATGIKQHQQRHMTGPVAFCLICGMGSKRSSRVTTHIKEMHWTSINRPAGEQFPCLVCGVMLDDGDSLSQHMMFHSEENVMQDVLGSYEGKVKCQECEKYFTNKKDLAFHKFYVHQDMPFKCYIDGCNLKFWSKAALDAHGKANHGRFMYECKRCDETFNSLKKKNMHLRRVHLVEIVRVKQSRVSRSCDICGKSFSSSFSLNRHRVDIHQRVKQRYTCDICGKLFNWKHRLNKHMLWHSKPSKSKEIVHFENSRFDLPEKSTADNAEAIIEEGEFVIGDFIDYGNDYGDCGDNFMEGEMNNKRLKEVDEGECSELLNGENEEGSFDGRPPLIGGGAVEKVLSTCTVYRCTICNSTFKCKFELYSHTKDVHKDIDQVTSFDSNQVLELSVVE